MIVVVKTDKLKKQCKTTKRSLYKRIYLFLKDEGQ